MKCSVCGQEAASYTVGERKYEPCGHIDNSDQALRQSKAAKDAINLLNKLWSEMTGSRSTKHTYNWWQIPMGKRVPRSIDYQKKF